MPGTVAHTCNARDGKGERRSLWLTRLASLMSPGLIIGPVSKEGDSVPKNDNLEVVLCHMHSHTCALPPHACALEKKSSGAT